MRKPTIERLEARREKLLAAIAELRRIRETLRRAALKMEHRCADARAAELKLDRS